MLFLQIFKTSVHPNRKSQRAEILRECSSPTTCHISGVRCHLFYFIFYKVVRLVVGGSVINVAYPVQFIDWTKVQSLTACMAIYKSDKQLKVLRGCQEEPSGPPLGKQILDHPCGVSTVCPKVHQLKWLKILNRTGYQRCYAPTIELVLSKLQIFPSCQIGHCM